MPSDLFTKLLLERIEELTKPGKTREQAEDDRYTFEANLVQEEPVSLEEVHGLIRELRNIRARLEQRRERGLTDDSIFISYAQRDDLPPSEYPERDDFPPSDDLPRERREQDFEAYSQIREQITDLEIRLNALVRAQQLIPMLRQWETRLTNTLESPREEQIDAGSAIVREYYSVSKADFDRFTPEVHIWFLERMLAHPSRFKTQDLTRLLDAYFAVKVDIVRYLIIQLLARIEDHNQLDYLDRLCRRITNPDSTVQGSNTQILQLVDILLDVALPTATATLRVLYQSLHQHQPQQITLIEDRVLERANAQGHVDQGKMILAYLDSKD